MERVTKLHVAREFKCVNFCNERIAQLFAIRG